MLCKLLFIKPYHNIEHYHAHCSSSKMCFQEGQEYIILHEEDDRYHVQCSCGHVGMVYKIYEAEFYYKFE